MQSNKPGAIIIEGHVQGLSNTRSLGETGIPVYVVDKIKCIARHSKYCRKFFLCPDFIQDEFAAFLIDLAEIENIKDWVLIPSNDHAVYTISKHKTQLEQYYKIITPGLDIIEKIYDKAALLELAVQYNIPIPSTFYFKGANDPVPDSLTFPAITKGRNGLSFYRAMRLKALLANDETELREQLHVINKKYNIDGIFTQELIPSDGNNKTISFTAFCIEGEIKSYWMGVKLREHPLQFGTATFAKSVYIQDCYDLSIPLIKSIKYTGVCEIEYLIDPRDEKYKLIEINARTWLWVGLAKFCGVNYARMIYDHVNHNQNDFPATYDINKTWINPFSDLAYAFQALMKGKMTFASYLSSFRNGAMVNALFLKNDWKPGVAYLLSLFSFLKKR
jgi:predicted ATP-grasp superfamily ATP-dependent carboligase